MLVLAGLGLAEKDLPVRALETLQECDMVYAEFYTNTAHDVSWLEQELGQDVTVCDRDAIEQPKELLAAAENKTVAVLVSGDPLAATTHIDLLQQAQEEGIETQVFHAPSIFTVVAETGLSLYKFGRVTTLPSEDKMEDPPPSVYNHVQKNVDAELHSLILLDVNLSADKALTRLQTLEEKHGDNIFTPDTELLVCERLGTDTAEIHRGTLAALQNTSFGSPPHCIIRPTTLTENEQTYRTTTTKTEG